MCLLLLHLERLLSFFRDFFSFIPNGGKIIFLWSSILPPSFFWQSRWLCVCVSIVIVDQQKWWQLLMVAVTIAIILFSVCDNYNYVVVWSRWLLDFVFFLLLHFISQNYLIVFNPYTRKKKPDYISQHHIESKEYEWFVFILWILSIYSSEKKHWIPSPTTAADG